WTALEIRTRPADRVGIDHDAGVAERRVLVAGRRLDGLVVDAGVGHGDAEFLEGGDGTPLQIEHPCGMAEQMRLGKVSAARIGDGGDAHAALAFGGGGEAFKPLHAGLAQAFGVGHDVGLRDRYEVRSTEEFADLDLVPQGLSRHRAGFPRQDVLFFVVELHQSIFTPASCTALPHLASSAFWNSANARPPTSPTAVTPSGSNLERKPSLPPMRSISAISDAVSASGSFAGANTPHQAMVSKPG